MSRNRICLFFILIFFLLLKNLKINECFNSSEYYNLKPVQEVEKLFTSNRLDLVVNFIYCEFYDKNLKAVFGKKLYLKWKKLEKGEKLIEHGIYQNIRKNRGESVKEGDKDYINKFNNLINDIKNDKFIFPKKLKTYDSIVINKDNKLIRGSHRVACNFYFNKNIYAIYNNEKEGLNNYQNLSPEYYEYVIYRYIKLKNNIRTFILYPEYNNTENDNFIRKTIKNDPKLKLLYKKDIYLNETGFIYFIIILYQIHNIKDINGNQPGIDYDIIRKKLKQSFNENKTSVYFVETECDNQYISNLKKNIIRKYIDNSENYYTFHVSDNKQESLNISQFILNKNNIFFANNNKISYISNNYPSLHEIKNTKINKMINVKKIKEKFEYKENLNNYCIVGSSVLSIFGLRKSRDIDIISYNFIKNTETDNHNNDFKKYLNLEPDEIIFNPINHMYFFDIKFIIPEILNKFKKSRFKIKNESKDENDILLLNKIL